MSDAPERIWVCTKDLECRIEDGMSACDVCAPGDHFVASAVTHYTRTDSRLSPGLVQRIEDEVSPHPGRGQEVWTPAHDLLRDILKD